jgi:retron-type reverse transcriptase
MSLMDEAKPFCIPKRAVWEAYKRVKENQGAAGVDGQTIADFEEDLSGNLYRIGDLESDELRQLLSAARVKG